MSIETIASRPISSYLGEETNTHLTAIANSTMASFTVTCYRKVAREGKHVPTNIQQCTQLSTACPLHCLQAE